MLGQFANKSAVITGAASGLGKAIAKLGASAGMDLMLVDFNVQSLEEAAHEISKSNHNEKIKIRTFAADVANSHRMSTLGETTFKEIGAPNFVFNNAGIARSGLCWEHSPEEWKAFLDINIMGVVHGIHVFTPMMLAAAKSDANYRGRIINTASMAGLVSVPLSAMYNVSKHAVVTLSETLYHDLNLVTNQVSASVLCPFFIPTNIDKKDSSPLSAGKLTPSQQIGEAFVTRSVSSGKMTAEEVAELVFSALSKNEFYIYTHPKTLAGFKCRSEDILLNRNPTSPSKPEITKLLSDELLKAYKK